MKKIFILLLAIATLAACNKSEVVDVNPGEAIQFGNAFVDNATKATDPTYGAVALEKFNVYGTVTGAGNTNVVNIYNGTEVTGTVAKLYEASAIQYWFTEQDHTFEPTVPVTSVPL